MQDNNAYINIDRYVDRLITESTPELPIWNIESIRQGKKPHWNYIDGCMITSLLQMSEISGDDKYYNFAESFIDYYVAEDGSILGYDIEKYNLDDINEGRVLFELYRRTGKEKYRLAIEKQKAQLDTQPRTNTGNFWHKLIYPHQIWLDGIYMAQVFSALYSREYGGGDYSDMLNQMVMMQMVSALTNMTDASIMSYAASLVGKTVTVGQYNDQGVLQEIVGEVTGTGTMGGEQVVFVNDKYYYMSEIMAVGTLPKTGASESGAVEEESVTDVPKTENTEAGNNESGGLIDVPDVPEVTVPEVADVPEVPKTSGTEN